VDEGDGGATVSAVLLSDEELDSTDESATVFAESEYEDADARAIAKFSYKHGIRYGILAERRRQRAERLRSFAVRRPYCHPGGSVILAYSAAEAIELANRAYGYASGTTAQDIEADDL
jgi:hypothetical protein